MNRRDAWVLREYDRELTITPDDREDMAYAREQREEMLERKSEWEAECAKDDALTKEEPEWERPKYDSYWEKRELTEDEEYEVKHKMYEFQKQQRWEQDVAACQRSMRGGY
jgi:hypothetical protein